VKEDDGHRMKMSPKSGVFLRALPAWQNSFRGIKHGLFRVLLREIYKNFSDISFKSVVIGNSGLFLVGLKVLSIDMMTKFACRFCF